MSCLSMEYVESIAKQSTILQDGRTNRKKIHKIERKLTSLLSMSLSFFNVLSFIKSIFQEILLGILK